MYETWLSIIRRQKKKYTGTVPEIWLSPGRRTEFEPSGGVIRRMNKKSLTNLTLYFWRRSQHVQNTSKHLWQLLLEKGLLLIQRFVTSYTLINSGQKSGRDLHVTIPRTLTLCQLRIVGLVPILCPRFSRSRDTETPTYTILVLRKKTPFTRV